MTVSALRKCECVSLHEINSLLSVASPLYVPPLPELSAQRESVCSCVSESASEREKFFDNILLSHFFDKSLSNRPSSVHSVQIQNRERMRD